ncbi:MAG: hypothetical protein LQ338_005284 [Usnochroma carphineum]|nr:MAG: hypothetical protein LQ338_005284 [Usnochroma carphineum]
MSVPYFASAFRQSHSGSVGNLQHKLSAKRKRGAEQTEFSTLHEPEVPSAGPTDRDDPIVEAAAKSRSLSGVTGLRQQHYSVLTSILHRCILEKDYARASRAWGMLLRTEVGGHPLDIRAQDRWGVGAELLLHGNTTLVGRVPNAAGPPSVTDEQLRAHDTKSVLQGLAKAKDYYERLILQFPYRKTAPDATSSLTFYPVMFGLWIYSTQLHYKIATQNILEAPRNRRSRDSSEDRSSDEGSLDSRSARSEFEGKAAARQTAVLDANEIIDRLNELLISPPYADDSRLWKIKGMLLLWTSHLLDYSSLPAEESGMSEDEPNPSIHGQGHPMSKVRERHEAVLKAQEAFSRALALGDTLDTRTREEAML